MAFISIKNTSYAADDLISGTPAYTADSDQSFTVRDDNTVFFATNNVNDGPSKFVRYRSGSVWTGFIDKNDLSVTSNNGGIGSRGLKIWNNKIYFSEYRAHVSGVDDVGTIWVINTISSNGTELGKMQPDTNTAYGEFGYIMDVGCGKVVTAQKTNNLIYIFNANTLEKELKFASRSGSTSDEEIITSISVGEGRIVVGQKYWAQGGVSGLVQIFNLNGRLIKTLTQSSVDYFGTVVKVGEGRIVVGTESSNLTNDVKTDFFIYDLNGNLIDSVDTLFDLSVDRVEIAYNRIFVANYPDDEVLVYDLNGTYITTIENPVTPGDFGFSLAVGDNRLLVGDRTGGIGGEVVEFLIDGTELTGQGPFGGAGNNLGTTVAIGDGIAAWGYSPTDANGGIYWDDTYVKRHTRVTELLDKY
jgi:hypothetical protein